MHTPTAPLWALYNAAGKHVATVLADDAEHALTRTLSSLGAVRAEPETAEQLRDRTYGEPAVSVRHRHRGW